MPAPCDRWGTGDAPAADHCTADEKVPAWKAAREKRRADVAAANGAPRPFNMVGRCRLTASQPELKALLVSVLETKM